MNENGQDKVAETPLREAALSPAQVQRLLEERARQLANPLLEAEAPAEMLELVPFSLNGEQFALETRYVQEILCRFELSSVPQAPRFVAGICGHRGQLLPVFELSAFLGLSEERQTHRNSMVIVGEGAPDFGILVDEVHHGLRIPVQSVVRVANPLRRGSGDYVVGVTERALTVLDGAALLREQALFIEAPADKAG